MLLILEVTEINKSILKLNHNQLPDKYRVTAQGSIYNKKKVTHHCQQKNIFETTITNFIQLYKTMFKRH